MRHAPEPTPLEAASDALLGHLDAEMACLESMCEVLEREAAALRRVAVDEVLEAARAKERVLSEQDALSRARPELLHALRPGATCLSEVREGQPAGIDAAIAARQGELRALVLRVDACHRRNRAFAQSAQVLVEAHLKVVSRVQAGPRTTYGPSGALDTGTPRHGLDRRA